MNAIFTIVAKNYIGLAQVLEASVRKNSSADFFVFVADELEETQSVSLPANIVIAKNVLPFEQKLWQQLSFKYNLVEFCTAIKPACFDYLFRKVGFEKVLYLDPDVFVFSSLDPAFKQLEKSDIVVTPHILNLQTNFKGNYQDHLFLLNGTFNLGFLALKKSTTTSAFIEWWHNRLLTYCFFDKEQGTATDQKWMNLLPSFFTPEQFAVSRHHGMNVAPWNFHERKILMENGNFFVQDRDDETSIIDPLVFVHFSGYDYSQIGSGQVIHKTTEMNAYTDYEIVFQTYQEALANSNFSLYSALHYSYNSFKNGKVIMSIHRRMYRRVLEEGIAYEHPFSTDTNTYYHLLLSKGLLSSSTFLADKLTSKSIKNFSSKLAYVNFFFTFIKKIIGIKRYSILIRFLKRYFSEENQVFLVNKEAGKKLL